MDWYGLVVGIIGTWRISHLLWAEDGPGRLIASLRRKAGGGFLGELMDCFHCLSLWAAAPLAFLLGNGLRDSSLLWLALSGGAILLERLTTRGSHDRASYVEHPPGEDDGMLRQGEESGLESQRAPGD